MPLSDFYHEEFLLNPVPYDPTRDTIQIFCAFHSCFKPGFVSQGGKRKYAIYALHKSGSYRTPTGNVVTKNSFLWSRTLHSPGRIVVEGNEDVVRKVIMLHPNPIHELLAARFFPGTYGVFPLVDAEAVEAVYDLIFEELNRKNTDNARLAGLFVQLIHEVVSQQQQSPYSRVMEKILSYITRKLHDPALSRSQIAEHCGVSLRTLNRLFAKELKTSVTQYIISTRLNKVRALLAVPELQIKSIAAQCGFRSSAFLTYRFRKRFGQTPAEYRRENFTSPSTK
ncbi:MAG: helix-turn-helix transcriptional regulator [Lentisphaeria bacterium]|nr:helix-turn-helix transcriptional regulator [Lentisphaeria bacterium]